MVAFLFLVLGIDLAFTANKVTLKVVATDEYLEARAQDGAAGQSFQAATEGMNAIGSDYFGKNLDKLARKRIEDTSSVEIGDIEVIEEAGNESN